MTRTFLWVTVCGLLVAPFGVHLSTALADLDGGATEPAVASQSPSSASASVALIPASGNPGESAEEILTKWSSIPFREIVVEDASLPPQTEETVVEGEPGLVVTRYRVAYANDIEVERSLLDEQTITPAVDRIVRRSPGPWGPSRGLPFQARAVVMEATAYAPYGPDTHGVTATGTQAKRGVVAVDPRVIALGSRVYVEGYGYAVAADTGGAIKGNRIDLCFDSASEVNQYGRRQVRVYVLP
jgi:3D (Asp-Asp-Asp) domain-containing protein